MRKKKKNNKFLLIVVNLALLAFVIPVTQFSKQFSANIFTASVMEPVHHKTSEEQLQLNVYDNFLKTNSKISFQNIIIDAIDNAKYEIFISMYSFNIDDIKSALLNAEKRGIKITILYTHKHKADFEKFWADAKDKINPIYIGDNIPSEHYSMHHKFMIVDPGTKTQKLYTGSWNWTHFQEDVDPNILLETSNSEIISVFQEEFQRLQNKNNGFNKFRLNDYRPFTHLIDFPNNAKVEIWFSPGREHFSMQNRIIELIQSAKNSIDISNTIIDSTFIGKAIVKKAREGLRIRVIFDEVNLQTDDSIYNFLEQRKEMYGLDNLELFIGGGINSNEDVPYTIFHHHNMIIDHDIVLTGTANWSFGGFFLNDENFLIIHDVNIVAKFKESFDNYLKFLLTK